MPDVDWSLNTGRQGPAWSWFDVERYACRDSVASAAARAGEDAAVEDYRQRGEALGYAPNLFFNPAFYIAAHPDAGARVAAGEFLCVFDHFAAVGWRGYSPHWLFDAGLYASLYGDLGPEAVANLGGLYGHFLNSGAQEGRVGHRLFDAAWYAGQRPDGALPGQPFARFLAALDASSATGMAEPRGSLFFDPVWYAATYPDVPRAIASGQVEGALHHYVVTGAREGRDPLCDFSEHDYRAANPDVDGSVRDGGFRNGYDHFLGYGATSLRSPCHHIDLAWYSQQPGVARDMATGRFHHAFAHLLAVGIPEGLPLLPPAPADFALEEGAARAAFAAQARRALPAFGRRPLDFGFEGMADLSVIVVLRNQFALTMQSLASLRATYRGRIQLIVVDNGSSDGTRQIAEVVRGAQLIRLEDNVGFLRACNLALKTADAAAVLYLNNDVVLHAGAVDAALARLGAEPSAGAVGGKIIRTHGLLQEAGCLLWRDGSADGWMRGAPPDAPEANYVRDVDYCSGAFLMVRGDLLRSLGGFDDAYAPAYYEEADLCLRIQAAGFRVVYDPAIVLTHFEYGSSRSLRAATALMLANRSTLRSRHAAALRLRLSDRNRLAEAAAFGSRGRRVLFLEDTVPLHRLGSGYGRAADVIGALAAAGWQVSVFPMHGPRAEIHQLIAEMPDTVEVLWDRDHRTLGTFLAERNGYYDLVWISRAHNLRQFQTAVGRSFGGVETAGLVLDTEAVFSLRDASRAALDGFPFDLARSLALEFEDAWQCDHVVAVNEAEAQVLRDVSVSSVGVIGFRQVARPTPRPWGERRGMLHVGALTVSTAPNVDALRWFMSEVHPRIESLVGADAARLTVAGFALDELDLGWLKQHPSVSFLGAVADLTPLYDTARVFVAPTRFAAGVPTKVLDAASHGLPVVATSLLAQQLQWQDGTQLLSAAASDAEGYALRVARLLTDADAWGTLREAALGAIETDFSPARFTAQIDRAITAGRRGAVPYA